MEEILKNRIVVVTEYFYPAERNDAILIVKTFSNLNKVELPN